MATAQPLPVASLDPRRLWIGQDAESKARTDFRCRPVRVSPEITKYRCLADDVASCLVRVALGSVARLVRHTRVGVPRPCGAPISTIAAFRLLSALSPIWDFRSRQTCVFPQRHSVSPFRCNSPNSHVTRCFWLHLSVQRMRRLAGAASPDLVKMPAGSNHDGSCADP